MESRRVRKTGAIKYPLASRLSDGNICPTEDKKHLIVKQRKRRKKLYNGDEQSKNMYQRSLSLSSVFEKVLPKAPSIPEILVIPPPEATERDELFQQNNKLLDNGDESDSSTLSSKSCNRDVMLLSSAENEYVKEIDGEFHPVKFMASLFPIATSWMNESEANNSKVLRWQKNPQMLHEVTSDTDLDEYSPIIFKEDQFIYSINAEETKELYDQMLQSIQDDDCKTLRSLLKKQIVDVNVPLEEGGSLLHEASYQGCVKCIKLLLKFGSFVNLSDDLGFTPLHAAVLGGNCDAIRLLIENDGLPNQTNSSGLTPCHLAVLADDIYLLHELVAGPAFIVAMEVFKSKKGRNRKPFKLSKSFETRCKECAHLKSQFPSKVPFVLERFHSSKNIPELEKIKFMFPSDLPMGLVVKFVRDRLPLSHNEALYFFVNGTILISASTTVGEVYQMYSDDDGFVYVTYATQETFGGGEEIWAPSCCNLWWQL